MISANCLVYVARRKLVQFLIVTKDDDSDVDLTEDGELMRLLEEAAFALQKSAVGMEMLVYAVVERERERGDVASSSRGGTELTQSGFCRL